MCSVFSPYLTIAVYTFVILLQLTAIFFWERISIARTIACLTWTLLFFLLSAMSGKPIFSSFGASAVCIAIISASTAKRLLLGENISVADIFMADIASIIFFFRLHKFWTSLLLVLGAALVTIEFLVYQNRNDIGIPRSFSLAAALVAFLALFPATRFEALNPEGIGEVRIAQRTKRRELSHFIRSLFTLTYHLLTEGIIEHSRGEAAFAASQPCAVANAPNIILILDESAFDVSRADALKAPDFISDYFCSFDGSRRQLRVEAFGSPTLYTEVSLFTGLSTRSFGGLKTLIPRIAPGRIKYSLTKRLKQCGYTSFVQYPSDGNFVNAREFYLALGFDTFRDKVDLQSKDRMQDEFYYKKLCEYLGNASQQSIFAFMFTTSNHFPWSAPLEPKRPEAQSYGNSPEWDEYIRRLVLNRADFAEFKERLKEYFPDRPFLIVRFGDHQPYMAHDLWEPSKSSDEQAKSIAAFAGPYFTTYYAVDAINFTPKAVLPNVDRLDVTYLGAIIATLAGLPLDEIQKEQLANLAHGNGAFYDFDGGLTARRFNGKMIRSGLLL